MRRFLILFLLVLLLWPKPAHADPITTLLFGAAFAATAWGAVVSAGITAVVGAAISFGLSALAGALGKSKGTSLGDFSLSAGNRLQMVQSSIETHKVIYGRCRVSGPIAFAVTTNTAFTDRILHLVIVLAAHEVDAIETVYLDETPLTLDGNGYATNSKFLATGDDDYAQGTQLVLVNKFLGTDNQTAISWLAVIAGTTGWTWDHRLRGLAHVYVRLSHSPDRFTSGIPNVSAIVRGKKVYDPRAGYAYYTDNYALCVRDYLSSENYGIGAPDDEINVAATVAAANISDENVTLINGSTQKRYTCNGVVDTAEKPADILRSLTACGAGAVTYSQGKFEVHAGAYDVPAISIDAGWLAGAIEVVARPQRNDLFNAVKGVYVDPNKDWQPTDFYPVTNATYEAQDGGDRIIRDIELPFVTDAERAQRLAKIALEKGRQGIVATVPCNMNAFQVQIWDTVQVTISQLGWSSKVFRVINWEMTDDGVILLTLTEEASTVYDWNAGQATFFDAAPDTNLPDFNTVSPPGAILVTEALYESTPGSGVKTKAILTWVASDDGFVREYEVSYKLAADTAYIPVSGRSRETTATVYDLAPGTWDFRVIAYNRYGVASGPATRRAEIYGLTAPPDDITGFTMNAVNGQAHLQWNLPPDLDVLVGGGVILKWSAKTAGATWSNGLHIGPQLSGADTKAVVELLAGTYLLKAVDSSGNESLNAATVVSTVALLAALNAVQTGDQHPTFPGTKTDMLVDGDDDTLMLDSEGLFDDGAGNFDDAAGDFDNGGGAGFVDGGSYQFYNVAESVDYWDLGEVYTSRVTIDADAILYDASEIFDQADGLFDDRSGLFDGEDITGISVEFFLRMTDDDPSGAPTWSAWHKFLAGDYTARAFQFKLEMSSAERSNNIKFSELGVTIDMPDREEKFLAQAIGTGGTTLNYAKPFFAQPSVGETIQSAVSGDTPKYTHVTSGGKYTGLTVQILNGGSGVARTVDVFVKGY